MGASIACNAGGSSAGHPYFEGELAFSHRGFTEASRGRGKRVKDHTVEENLGADLNKGSSSTRVNSSRNHESFEESGVNQACDQAVVLPCLLDVVNETLAQFEFGISLELLKAMAKFPKNSQGKRPSIVHREVPLLWIAMSLLGLLGLL